MSLKLYEVWLDADEGCVRNPSYAGSKKQLGVFCAERSLYHEDGPDAGTAFVFALETNADELGRQDFVAQLPVPGNEPAVIEGKMTRVKPRKWENIVGLTA